jgi:hypothetical protein
MRPYGFNIELAMSHPISPREIFLNEMDCRHRRLIHRLPPTERLQTDYT